MFKITNATGGYGKTTIIRDVSLNVKAGEMVALLGHNGVGKSTLMRHATGLIPATSGLVAIGWHTAPPAPAKRARLGLGYVPQGRFVFPRMTVAENIAVAAASNGFDAKEIIVEMMEDFPLLAPKVSALAGGLSGGQQQQVLALARALAIRPKILLLDESTDRIPSAAFGIYGFKPSYGRASRHGVLPLSMSFNITGAGLRLWGLTHSMQARSIAS